MNLGSLAGLDAIAREYGELPSSSSSPYSSSLDCGHINITFFVKLVQAIARDPQKAAGRGEKFSQYLALGESNPQEIQAKL
ncbi:MAG: hypothetical protein AB4290_03675 [Spirulina sp.]